MSKNALTELGLSPDQTADLAGTIRTRLFSFLLRWEQYEVALACLEAMILHNPGLVSLYDAKARALLGLGQPEAALASIEARHEIRSSLSSRTLETRVRLALNQPTAALALARDLVAENPDSIMALTLLGEVHLARGELDAAQAVYRRMGDLRPHSRAYARGMLDLYRARDDQVSASGYAVRLERSVAEKESLPAKTLRQLREYYQESGEFNRARQLQAALATLYDAELADLKAAFAGDLQVTIPSWTPPLGGARDRSTETKIDAAALPSPENIPVPAEDRQRLEDAAQRFFGFEHLLPGQVETMALILQGQDVLTVLPTGGGKSLCYQLPALLDERGTTLVVSPLIALMKDQVDSLPSGAQASATTINSSLEGDELCRRIQRIVAGRYRLVYAAPERLRQTPFVHALRQAGINRLIIDEAHCVSVWGHDFRPDYLYIAAAREALGNPPLLAMTATAPPRVRRDIVQRLKMRDVPDAAEMRVIATDAHRPNLFLAAICAQNTDAKLRHLLELCHTETGSGIIYAGTRARCERIAALLCSRGIQAGYYHAGIGDRSARAAAQEAFMCGQVRVMVATVAFGMGIDKPDIRFIFHFQLPPSLEAYYQEIGRAGRDGLPARCVLIYSQADRATLTRRAKRDAPTVDFLRGVYTAVRHHLSGATLGRIPIDDLRRDVRADDTPVRVALSTLEEAGLLRRHQDAPHSAVVRLRGSRWQRAEPATESDWRVFLDAARLLPGQYLTIDPICTAAAASLDPVNIESRILGWANDGLLDYRPSGRELLLEILPPPADAMARLKGLIDRYSAIQAQRIDEIAAYAATDSCRHGHICTYLSGKVFENCQSCDNCQPSPALIGADAEVVELPSEREQLLAILNCLADSPGGWGRANLTYILLGNQRASMRARDASQWGALAFRSRTAVRNLIDRLLVGGLLRTRKLDHGGETLLLTRAGRAALDDPARLSSLTARSRPPTKHIQSTVGAKGSSYLDDEELFQRLRAWRRERALATGVPAYIVAHDAVLRRIAQARPQDITELDAIPGIGPKKLSQFGDDILGLVRGAGMDGVAHASDRSKDAT
jgi:ATP-dependent DNA helicase RecQ